MRIKWSMLGSLQLHVNFPHNLRCSGCFGLQTIGTLCQAALPLGGRSACHHWCLVSPRSHIEAVGIYSCAGGSSAFGAALPHPQSSPRAADGDGSAVAGVPAAASPSLIIPSMPVPTTPVLYPSMYITESSAQHSRQHTQTS
eukprot:COSAG05_NODE_477_length_9434_cov_1.772319_4_plen_142_part_00